MQETNSLNSVRTTPKMAMTFKILHFFLIFLVLGLGVCIVSMNMIRYFATKNMASTKSSSFHFCYDEMSRLECWIKPPSTLMHNMNDTELFWRATFAPRIKQYPYRRVPKMAFMFLTRGPLPLAPLWERFFRGNEGLYSIYIHSLPGYKPDYSRSSVFYDRQIPNKV